jgi:chemotaxis regulatin CheY-phosphate phosphatase CheZ
LALSVVVGAEEALEAFKEIGPVTGADDEYIAAVVLIALAPQIAEAAQGIQGARDDRLRYAENSGKAAHRVGPGER